jgi:3-hydroxybenzoate/4-hydroxybenzoate---CoA ligase
LNAADFLLGPQAQQRHGARTALLCGDEVLSYRELAARVERAAAALAGLGVRPEDRVLFLMRDTPESAAAWLGAVRAGAVAVALNNRLTESDFAHIVADSGARLVLMEERFAAAHRDSVAGLAAAGKVVIAGAAGAGIPAWRHACDAARPAPFHETQAGAPAFALYTSGTTGRPKGALHTHGGFSQLGKAFDRIGIGAGERVFTTSKFFFAYGLEHGLLGVLAVGATSILYPDWPDAEAVFDVIARHKPAAVFGVPTIYRRLLAGTAERLATLRSVRRFVSAGERLSPQLVEQWKRAASGEILNLYGMSETFCACIVTPPGTSDGVRTGTLLDGVEARLLENGASEQGAAANPGVLWVRHPALASGYVNLPERTREQFRGGWFCTRDIFALDAQGFYVHQGRTDELVKIAGQWVWPGEIEAAAAGERAIAEAVCVPVPDRDGLERLALFVTPRGDAQAAEQAALQACERGLPRHKRPKWVRVVDELPRTATGKVQRFRLREILERENGEKP